MHYKSLSIFQNANVPVNFTFVFVAVGISRERLVVRRHFSSLVSPFQSRVTCWKIPNGAVTMCQITSVDDLIVLSSPDHEKKRYTSSKNHTEAATDHDI